MLDFGVINNYLQAFFLTFRRNILKETMCSFLGRAYDIEPEYDESIHESVFRTKGYAFAIAKNLRWRRGRKKRE